MRISRLAGIWVAAAVASAAPLAAQHDAPDDRDIWRLEGLTTGFCVQFLIDPASEAVRDLPPGFSVVGAQQTPDLHISLRSVVESQPEYGSWAPSSLCLYAVDTVRTAEFTLADKSGRHPYLLGAWSVSAVAQTGQPTNVLLDLFTASDRLVRAARRSGVGMRQARFTLGKVPAEDEEGRPSTDDRFQVKVGKTTVTWDGRPAGEETGAQAELATTWTLRDAGIGGLTLTPTALWPMAGSLKVEGKDALAKALRASPTRFAGPEYRGGAGILTLKR
jgi:hypothetical protein